MQVLMAWSGIPYAPRNSPTSTRGRKALRRQDPAARVALRNKLCPFPWQQDWGDIRRSYAE